MRLKISYPSGTQFEISGQWLGPELVGENNVVGVVLESETRIGGQVVPAGGLLLGDPRGVYQDAETGKVLYQPRDPRLIGGLIPVWREWLVEHPEWPSLLEVDFTTPTVVRVTSQVPGAILNGTLVEKVNSRDGDSHKDGDRARVVGSIVGREGQIAYCVEWDDLPGLTVFVGAERVRVKV